MLNGFRRLYAAEWVELDWVGLDITKTKSKTVWVICIYIYIYFLFYFISC